MLTPQQQYWSGKLREWYAAGNYDAVVRWAFYVDSPLSFGEEKPISASIEKRRFYKRIIDVLHGVRVEDAIETTPGVREAAQLIYEQLLAAEGDRPAPIESVVEPIRV